MALMAALGGLKSYLPDWPGWYVARSTVPCFLSRPPRACPVAAPADIKKLTRISDSFLGPWMFF
jgi:hypothetical protein